MTTIMKSEPTPPDREVLTGLAERVTYQNTENGFCVVRIKARGHRELVTLVGHAAAISAGEWITASGSWVNDRTHGQQFKARFLKTSAPTSAEGIEKYLASGMIRGIGLLEVPQELVRTALDLELADGTVIADMVGDKPCAFLAGLYRAERGIAERLLQLGTGKLPWPWIDPEKAIPWIEQRTGLVFAESQRSAVRLALTSKVLVITGGPGVGKTTLILRILSAKGVRLLLCAPTGRAAKRMNEATGFEVKTIHRLLEVRARISARLGVRPLGRST